MLYLSIDRDKDYFDRANSGRKLLSPRNRQILVEIIEAYRIKEVHDSHWLKKREELKKLLWTVDTKNLTSIFTGDEFMVLIVLLGEEWAKKFKKVWDRLPLYPYSLRTVKRPFRVKSDDTVYLECALEKLESMIYLVMHNFSYLDCFTQGNDFFFSNQVVADLLALEIDEGNERILEEIDNIIHRKNSRGILTKDIIKGMLMSHSHKMHEWVGELLLRDKLKEESRQAIVQVIEGGSKEGFIFLMQLIVDHNLIKFSSIAHSMDVWTGLNMASDNPLVTEQCIEAGYKALTDKNYLDESLKSNDPMLIYMALWAEAFYDMRRAEDKVKRLLMDKYKKLVALCFLRHTQLPLMQHRLAMPLLDEEDLEIKYWVICNLFTGQEVPYYFDSHDVFGMLKEILDTLPEKEVTFNESVFTWQNVTLSSDSIIEKMLLKISTNLSNKESVAEKNIDVMTDYINTMGKDVRYTFITYFLQNPKTEKQRNALINMMKDKSSSIRSSACDIVKKLGLLKENELSEGTANKPKNGFEFCDPAKELVLEKIGCSKGFSYKDVMCSSLEEIQKRFGAFSILLNQYKDFEYEVTDSLGISAKVVLGHQTDIVPIISDKEKGLCLEDYPFSKVWKEEAKRQGLTAKQILEILFYYYYTDQLYLEHPEEWEDWYDEIMKQFFKINIIKFYELIIKMPYFYNVSTILSMLLKEFPKKEIFWISFNMSRSLYKVIPDDKFDKPYIRNVMIAESRPVRFWNGVMRNSVYDNESFKAFFYTVYAYYKAAKYKAHTSLKIEDFERAYNLELVDENELYLEMCTRPLSAENIHYMTDAPRKEEALKYKKLREVTKRVIDHIVGVEIKRGDMETPVSHLATKIQRCEGISTFVSIIVALKKKALVRGYRFSNEGSRKKEILSHLLKCCYPKEGEDENILGELLKDVKVTEKQLIDAAMYAPQWLDIVGKYLGWKGLKMAGWYFHAHIHERFSNEKTGIVARFSPIEPEDFRNGAFDIDWFLEAYNTLGKERFNVVYDSAKYIAGGDLHRRSQLFADAVLGRLGHKEAEGVIISKRNKEYVLCYGLIQLSKDKKELLRRYEFLQRFIKESNQFGAQRRAGEQNAGAIGIYNLSRNAGFADVHRFTWYMETEKMKTIRAYLEPKAIKDVMTWLVIDKDGEAHIKVIKEGKELKNIPSGLKKEPYIKELQETKRSLKDQYIRARKSLENAMELEEKFSADELSNLSLNPVIEPLLRELIFISGNRSGYFRDGVLVDYLGNILELKEDENLIIAHPVHLYKHGIWAEYQKDIFDRSIVQPFKQAFRELYRPNEDELESRKISYRYSGYQVQPKRAKALLKTRGWVLDGYKGFEKVYYKQNIVTQLIVRADWFSPAEVESPTIEYILFENRKTGDSLEFRDIPECIFSEVMRDIDLVVSAAHVGSVDAEASLSTVEMRKTIIIQMIRLFKLSNVTLKEAHALIKGKYGEYTVHLGSGVVHKMATGAINILAIHSGHRGKIFLPFMDEDPRFAEIITKIVLLAEDKKIKDPIILEQITR